MFNRICYAIVFALSLATFLPSAVAQRTTFTTNVNLPRDMVELPDGRIIVAEPANNRISVIADDGSRSDFATGLNGPEGLIQLQDGRILTAEFGAGRISVIADDGSRSDFATGLSTPEGLLQLDDGRVLVTEWDRVTAIASDGSKSVVAFPLAKAVGLLQLLDGRILVSEGLGGEVSLINSDATVTPFARGLDSPAGLMQLPDGRILVAELGNRVSVITDDGSRTDFATGLNIAYGLLQLSDGRLLVSETSPSRISELAVVTSNSENPSNRATSFSMRLPEPNPVLGMARLSVSVTTPTNIRIEVFNALGRRVAVVLDEHVASSTVLFFDMAGLAPGPYVVRAEGAGGSLSHMFTVVR